MRLFAISAYSVSTLSYPVLTHAIAMTMHVPCLPVSLFVFFKTKILACYSAMFHGTLFSFLFPFFLKKNFGVLNLMFLFFRYALYLARILVLF